MLDDDDAGTGAQHLPALVENELHDAGVLAGLRRQFQGARRRRDVTQDHCASLRLRHDLLRQHHHVAGLQHFAGGAQRLQDDRRQVVARSHQRHAGERREGERGGSCNHGEDTGAAGCVSAGAA
jgi:hypothetical protein